MDRPDTSSHLNSSGLLSVENLTVAFPARGSKYARVVRAVDGVSFSIAEGSTLGLVGESGSGKTTAGRAMLRLVKVARGKVLYRGRDVTTISESEFRPLRQKLQVIFQDPYSSLDPRMTVRQIVAEALRAFHPTKSNSETEARVAELLGQVGLSPQLSGRYPHEFSGGQRQRVAIARVLAVEPEFIVADEPLSALDVSIQAQILNLLSSLKQRLQLSFLFISHDLRAVRHIADEVAVMYLGKIVEQASAPALYARPLHPYTMSLMSAVPKADPAAERERKPIVLSGDIPSAVHPPSGCRFHTRCWLAEDRCRREEPLLRNVGDSHLVACHLVADSKTALPDK